MPAEDLPEELVTHVLDKAQRRGKGGRQPADDPMLDPNVNPKRAKRILANRRVPFAYCIAHTAAQVCRTRVGVLGDRESVHSGDRESVPACQRASGAQSCMCACMLRCPVGCVDAAGAAPQKAR